MRYDTAASLVSDIDHMPPIEPWRDDDSGSSDSSPLGPHPLAIPNATDMEAEVAFVSGVTSANRVAAKSFWTWNDNIPATYSSTTSDASKWGSTTPGTASGVISYYFDPAANWTATEKDALASGLALWSAEANVTFVEATSSVGVKLTFQRGTDGGAYETDTHTASLVGAATVGVKSTGRISISTATAGFGPLGDAFPNYGGYPWETLVHEEGHFLGLGHGGAYNGSVNVTTQQFSAADSRLYTLMSYIDPFPNSAGVTPTYNEPGTFWGTSLGSNGSYYANRPTTPMMLDIVAIQRLYGAPVTTPLGGNNVFGFNSNITGMVAKFFDFTVNTRPVVTLFSTGLNNTLDLSGFTAASTINLEPGSFSSAGYDTRLNRAVTNNIAIALNTRIDNAVGGPGADTITGNAFANVLRGGGGSDVVSAGFGADVVYGDAGSDTLYGNQDNDVLYGGADNDVAYGGQGNDSLFGDAGDDALYGNLGDDLLNGGVGSNRLDGGDGVDTATYTDATASVSVSLLLSGAQSTGVSTDLLIGIENLTGSAFADTLTGDGLSNVISGGAGADVISGGFGADVLYGNQDNDVLYGNQDSDVLYGGQGADVLYGGQGDDVLFGNAGADILYGNLGVDTFRYALAADSSPSAPDLLADFSSAQGDKIDLRAIRTGPSDSFAFSSSGGITTLDVDLGGDSVIDMRILIAGVATAANVDWAP